MNKSKLLILLNRIIFILSLAGLLMGIYVLQSFLRDSGIVCFNGQGCETVRKSALAWPLGIPVPLIGVIGYTFLLSLSFLRTIVLPNSSHDPKLATHNSKLLIAMLGMTIFGVCFVTWFTYTELFLIKGICSWCAISAVNMYILFGLVVLSFKLLNQPNHLNHPK